ncbi:MAG: Molybdenum ABC transporter periplasmic molybdate-binding protein [Limisphaerales bacterium]|nr:MAG: Molybdenum ABC transporter periplasmic molybdate-binding protein [Limisphaerales bacterium]KAG0508255.1 MAG: Molybdenum ABC transporter periplasmic molybdate-binding protein [Limisphaerales bacterium]TXT49570.1 MAG: Molybdenum ABC transporter periplasmic molybdate-binding protein [Limisphaerales bacterium]
MKKLAALLFAIAALFAALALLQRRDAAPATGSARANALTVYCAAGLKQPVEAIAAKYRAEFGVEVRLQYGPTGALISNFRVAKRGDLFIAADDGSVADARKYELVREVLPLVRQHPVIAVRAGNPKNIRSIADLLRDDVKLALTNPDAASISRVSKAALGETWTKLAARAAVMKPTVTEVAADLSLGAVDAAILWDATVPQFKGLVAVDVPELKGRVENASAAVLAFTAQSAAALKFARYLAAPEKGGTSFQSHGFQLAGGDKWAAKPDLILYSGGVNRPAVEKLLRQFADREGVSVTTVFNGCGILCATMKTMGDSTNPKFPDAYYACDLCFVPPVAEQFPEAVMLTETDIGIVVRKGNPHGVRTLADLALPGLKVGLCNAEQSTLGFMTRGMLKQTGLLDSVRKNVVVEVPTADFLINQMRAGGLEAAIVYRVNAAPQAEHIEFFPIKHEGAKAIQPFAVRKDSPNKQLATRLLDFLKANRGEFEQAGFQWRGNEPALKSKDIKVPDYLLEK